jgi:hypothetical protein
MMTPKQKAALVVAQAAMLNAEISKMNAANDDARAHSYGRPFVERHYLAVIEKYESTLGYNEVLLLFKEP